jgi:transposase
MKLDPRSWVRERWAIVYHALIAPRKAEEIARDTGVSVTTVRRVISSYNRLGLASIETPGKGGRRHAYMSVEQERHFLQPFSRERRREKLPRGKTYSEPLKPRSSMRYISRASIAC